MLLALIAGSLTVLVAASRTTLLTLHRLQAEQGLQPGATVLRRGPDSVTGAGALRRRTTREQERSESASSGFYDPAGGGSGSSTSDRHAREALRSRFTASLGAAGGGGGGGGRLLRSMAAGAGRADDRQLSADAAASGWDLPHAVRQLVQLAVRQGVLHGASRRASSTAGTAQNPAAGQGLGGPRDGRAGSDHLGLAAPERGSAGSPGAGSERQVDASREEVEEAAGDAAAASLQSEGPDASFEVTVIVARVVNMNRPMRAGTQRGPVLSRQQRQEKHVMRLSGHGAADATLADDGGRLSRWPAVAAWLQGAAASGGVGRGRLEAGRPPPRSLPLPWEHLAARLFAGLRAAAGGAVPDPAEDGTPAPAASSGEGAAALAAGAPATGAETGAAASSTDPSGEDYRFVDDDGYMRWDDGEAVAGSGAEVGGEAQPSKYHGVENSGSGGQRGAGPAGAALHGASRLEGSWRSWYCWLARCRG